MSEETVAESQTPAETKKSFSRSMAVTFVLGVLLSFAIGQPGTSDLVQPIAIAILVVAVIFVVTIDGFSGFLSYVGFGQYVAGEPAKLKAAIAYTFGVGLWLVNSVTWLIGHGGILQVIAPVFLLICGVGAYRNCRRVIAELHA